LFSYIYRCLFWSSFIFLLFPTRLFTLFTLNALPFSYIDMPIYSIVNSCYSYQQESIASWYGPRFHGRLTSNREIYDQWGLTAAHRRLPFGTHLRITHLSNGTVVRVRVNDRGPYIRGREIDLSKGAAIQLGMVTQGLAKVSIDICD